MAPEKQKQFFYREPRLEMSVVGRFAIRIISYSSYGILSAAAVAFSFSDVSWLKAIGFLLVLFLFLNLAHFLKLVNLLLLNKFHLCYIPVLLFQ